MFKRIIKIISSILVIAIITGCCCFVCNHPSEEVENTVDSFYREEAESLDVVFLGSSACSKDFQPIEIWKQSGISSYNYSVGACSSNIYKSILKEIVSKQKKSVIVVDIDGFMVADKFQREEDPVRLWVDSMPKNDNWRSTINELCASSKLERYFPFSRYHRNMVSPHIYLPLTYRLAKKEILKQKDILKGSTLNESKIELVGTVNNSGLIAKKLYPLSAKYLKDFLEYAKENTDNEIIFVDLPKAYYDKKSYSEKKHWLSMALQLKKDVEAYGYDFYEFNTTQNKKIVNLKDFADSLHLTTTGGIKFSRFFADVLINKYHIKPTATGSKEWQAAYDEGIKILKNQVK